MRRRILSVVWPVFGAAWVAALLNAQGSAPAAPAARRSVSPRKFSRFSSRVACRATGRPCSSPSSICERARARWPAARMAPRSFRATPSRAGCIRRIAGARSAGHADERRSAHAGADRGDQDRGSIRARVGRHGRAAAAQRQAGSASTATRRRSSAWTSRPSSATTGRSSCRCRRRCRSSPTGISPTRSIASSRRRASIAG